MLNLLTEYYVLMWLVKKKLKIYPGFEEKHENTKPRFYEAQH